MCPYNYPAATLTGIALHSGLPSTITAMLRPEDGRGLRFTWPGFDAPLEAGDLIALRRNARRATVLENGAGSLIRTPEHLLAAALFFADAPLDILCDAVEPPGLDGSALPFYELFKQVILASERDQVPVGVRGAEGMRPSGRITDAASITTEDDNLARRSQPDVRAQEYESKLEWEYEGPEGSLRATPHTHFCVDSVWEYGEVQQHFALTHAADAPVHIFPARTFIAYRDWKVLSGGQDLLAGAGLNSGILVATSRAEFIEAQKNLPASGGNTFPLLHPESFRMEDELARHKVLDLLGDLALNGLALPKLRLTIRNGGHALNHLLLDRLQGEIRRNP